MARSFFESESPAQFFKVVLESDLREGKLRIPPKFVRKHGNMLSDSVSLEVPSGDVWEVRLEKIGGGIWLEEGLEDFMIHNHIGFGYFIVFRHKGKSKFCVSIFDITACEIEYPISSDTTISSDTKSEEISEDEISVTECHKEVREISYEDMSVGECNKDKFWQQPLDLPCPVEISKVEQQAAAIPRGGRVGKGGDLNNWSFVRVLKPYEKYFLDIPAGFARETGLVDHKSIKIRDLGRRTWELELRRTESSSRHCICGWHIIFAENKLKVGNTLVFMYRGNIEVEFEFVKGSDRTCATVAMSRKMKPQKRGKLI